LDVAGRHGSGIHHPSTMVPTYPSTISQSYGAGGAGRVTEATEEIIIPWPGDPSAICLAPVESRKAFNGVNIARGKQRPGKNAIAFGERHSSAGLIAV